MIIYHEDRDFRGIAKIEIIDSAMLTSPINNHIDKSRNSKKRIQ